MIRSTIRPYTAADRPAIEDLLAAMWGNDTGACDYYAPEDAERGAETFHQTLVAVTANDVTTVVGFGNAGIYAEHPAHVLLSVNIAPAHQRRGIGRGLFQALTREAQTYPPRPWMTATYEDKTAALAFFQRRQFTEAMRTAILHLERCHARPAPVSCAHGAAI